MRRREIEEEVRFPGTKTGSRDWLREQKLVPGTQNGFRNGFPEPREVPLLKPVPGTQIGSWNWFPEPKLMNRRTSGGPSVEVVGQSGFLQTVVSVVVTQTHSY